MLLDRYRQLLTAYVDGELSSRQRRHVARLLRRSAEARQLLQQLQGDAHALRQLPRPPLPADLTSPVLHRIAERRLAPGQRRIAKADPASAWMGPIASWAAAAAVLLILGAASYLYFIASLEQPAKIEMARTQSESSAPAPHPDQPKLVVAKKDETQTATRERPPAKIDRPSAEGPPKVVQRPDGKLKPTAPDKPPSPAKQESALTERVEMFPLERVPDLLPVIVKVSDLDREPAHKQFLAELGKDSDFRIELPCTNGAKAIDRVQKAARTLHFGLVIDKQAQERIKAKWRTNYALYVEDLTPEELTQFVRQIGAEDRKSAAGKPAEAQIDRLVLMRMTARHRKELSTLLGVDPSVAVPGATGPLGVDPRKSLADATARQVGQALAGQGGAPRPGSGKPPEHLVLVLAYNPVHPSPASDEIKHFLEGRKPARTGTIRVLLVLRGG